MNCVLLSFSLYVCLTVCLLERSSVYGSMGRESERSLVKGKEKRKGLKGKYRRRRKEQEEEEEEALIFHAIFYVSLGQRWVIVNLEVIN